ncbi:peptidase M20 [Natrialba hulunbeirensis JCM 10989]|uniref:Peptidase M20 n=1 Tax=Natrialba hulunbeirensis JCM 10989 TaxID=1227493 RepID=M0AEJ4_9EURY|nr:ArgE/DapE family deacylase [Natrialba hulunbeirensis]ELY95763.1 peptidase M20 [Natrialba hulunbeirensis JCM 10989]
MVCQFKSFTEKLLSFRTESGNEQSAQQWIRGQLDACGFETYEWTADPDLLASHPSFPSDPATLDTAKRPSVAGVVEFGDPEEGETIVLNGHVDVVPAENDQWDTDPFTPTWDGENLIARGAADMKSGLSACLFAAKELVERNTAEEELNGRLVVESVVGEEEGGIGAAMAALSNPYPFERDAAIVAEPTELELVTAVEGSVMLRLELEGKSAHAATRWRGESVLPHFERIRTALRELETERSLTVTHPLYEQFETPWPISVGTVQAGSWASSVPSTLTAEIRVGVAPGETVSEVESIVRDRIDTVVDGDDWLEAHPPSLERFSVQFEPASVSHDEPIVQHLQAGMEQNELADTTPKGATYGADSRHYQAAGIPTVLFGPASIDNAHFPNEYVHWDAVEQSKDVLVDTLAALFGGEHA